MSDIEFKKAEYGNKQEQCPKPTTFDPRHPSDRTLDSDQIDVLLEKFKSACPDSGVYQFWSGSFGVAQKLNTRFS